MQRPYKSGQEEQAAASGIRQQQSHITGRLARVSSAIRLPYLPLRNTVCQRAVRNCENCRGNEGVREKKEGEERKEEDLLI